VAIQVRKRTGRRNKMAGPWEKFQTVQNDRGSEGPWAKFQAPQAPQAAEEKSILDKEVPIIGGTGRGYVQGTLNALPGAGAAIGGVLGGTAGTAIEPGGGTALGGVGGAALGGAAGESLKDLGEKYILGQNKTRSDIYGNPAKGALSGAAQEAGGQLIGAGIQKASQSPIVKKVGSYLGKGASKLGSALTGVPESEIETYAKHADEINDMAKSSDNNTFQAANDLREKWQGEIQDVKKSLNSQISSALERDGGKTISQNPILEALEAQKAKLNPKLDPDQISQIDALAKKVSSLANENGEISLKEAHELKNHLQDIASPAYGSGQIFQSGKNTQFAAKSAARAARGLINETAPEIANANNQLAELHDIEDSMNRNILKANAPEASILAAGNEGNLRNAEGLKRLSAMTGSDMNADASKLAAMRTFGSPGLLPQGTTGKTLTHAGLGVGLGGLLGHEAGIGWGAGAVVGTALTSPQALKSVINAGLITKEAAKQIAENPQAAGMILRKFPAAVDFLTRQQQGSP
jgi:hypothetical protein